MSADNHEQAAAIDRICGNAHVIRAAIHPDPQGRLVETYNADDTLIGVYLVTRDGNVRKRELSRG